MNKPNIHVVRENRKWAIKRENDNRSTAEFAGSTRDEREPTNALFCLSTKVKLGSESYKLRLSVRF